MPPSRSSSLDACLLASGAIVALNIVKGVFVDCAAIELGHVRAFVQL